MRSLTLAASLMCCLVSLSLASAAMAADDPEHNVCLVSFNSLGHVQNGYKDITSVARGSLMPLETAKPLVSIVSAIWTYPDLATTIKACQCLENPMPANSLVQRQKSLAACPKPLSDH